MQVICPVCGHSVVTAVVCQSCGLVQYLEYDGLMCTACGGRCRQKAAPATPLVDSAPASDENAPAL